MNILLVAATQFEITPFLNNERVDVLICGIGSPQTVYHLTKKLNEKKYAIVIQAGIAGSFSKKIKKGEVVIIKEDAFADIGAEEKGKFKTVFQFGFADKDEFPFTNGFLINQSDILEKVDLKKVKAVTVNKISDVKKQQKQIKKIFNPEVESMEGAAFHFVCLQQNVPFIQVRSISNKVGERDKSKWKIKKAIINLNKALQLIIEKFSNIPQ